MWPCSLGQAALCVWDLELTRLGSYWAGSFRKVSVLLDGLIVTILDRNGSRNGSVRAAADTGLRSYSIRLECCSFQQSFIFI